MKKNLLLTFGVLWICGLFVCPSVKSQSPDGGSTLQEQAKQGKKNHQLQPIVDDPGVDCYDWTLDIRTLKDTTHRIYWKQDDCIRVHTKNNPFIFRYDMTFNEQLIPEDDPLGAFAGKFGLKLSSTSSPAPNPAPANPQAGPAKKPPSPEAAALNEKVTAKLNTLQDNATNSPKDFTIHKNDKTLAFESGTFSAVIGDSKAAFVQGNYDAANEKLRGLGDQIDQAEKTTSLSVEREKSKRLHNEVSKLVTDVDKAKAAATADETAKALSARITNLNGATTAILNAVKGKQEAYTEYANGTTLSSQLQSLIDDSAKLDDVRANATTVRNQAFAELQALTDSQGDPGSYRSHAIDQQFVTFANDAAKLHKSLSAQQADLTDQVDQAARQVIFAACTYKFFSDTDVSSIKTGIIDPIDAVLNDKLSFGYVFSSKKREGPWVDPESVTVTVTRTRASLFGPAGSASAVPQTASASYTCSTDTTDLFEFGDTYGSFDAYFTDKPVTAKNLVSDSADTSKVKSLPNLVMKNGNTPQVTSTPKSLGSAEPAQPRATSPQKPADTSAVSNTVLRQDWLFGKARLVVSGGLSSAFLRKQEFQRSSSISGTTSPTVIGLKTNTIYRDAPMLYGHVLLYSRRHDSDAWYGTFGVTANSDTQGTDPEFLLGFSRSLAHQRFFFTGGAYIGERQKLDGGLMVGQIIPSTLTGDLPVTKSYHVGFGIGISFRLGSTKNPQTNTSGKPANSATNPAVGSQ